MNKPYMIAITGGSGSGKSTLAQALLDKLGEDKVLLMGEDNYYKPREHQHPDAPLWSMKEMEERVDFDDPASKNMDMYEAHLVALRQGRTISQPVYDFTKHDRIDGAEKVLSPRPIIVCEGVHTLSDKSYFNLFDLTIFVETPADLRLARRIERDVNERNRELNRVLAQYLNFVRPAHAQYTEPAKFLCDLIIKDEGPLAAQVGSPNARAEARLLAPLWSYLIEEGVITS